jgi:hypothetical protein
MWLSRTGCCGSGCCPSTGFAAAGGAVVGGGGGAGFGAYVPVGAVYTGTLVACGRASDDWLCFGPCTVETTSSVTTTTAAPIAARTATPSSDGRWLRE